MLDTEREGSTGLRDTMALGCSFPNKVMATLNGPVGL